MSSSSYLLYSHLGPAVVAMRSSLIPITSPSKMHMSTSANWPTSSTRRPRLFLCTRYIVSDPIEPSSKRLGLVHLAGVYCFLLPPNPPSHQASAKSDFLERNRVGNRVLCPRELALSADLDQVLILKDTTLIDMSHFRGLDNRYVCHYGELRCY